MKNTVMVIRLFDGNDSAHNLNIDNIKYFCDLSLGGINVKELSF